MDKENLQSSDTGSVQLRAEEGIIQPTSPLTLDLDAETIQDVVDGWIRDSRKFFKEKYNLFERRTKNEVAVFGRQIEEKEKQKLLKKYETRYLDNVLYEIEASLKPLAMNRLPDHIVTPGNSSPESVKTAEDISKCLDTDIKKRANRQVLAIGFKHLPVYFTAILKVRWDPEKEDFIFENIHPDYIDVDNTCNTKDADDMKWIAQTLPISVQECIMRFPKKKEELLKKLRADGLVVEEGAEPKTRDLLTEIKIKEIWYDWYKPQGDKWEKISAVIWKYKDVVLENMKNPNFDYEGYSKYTTFDPLLDKKRDINEQEMMMFAVTGQTPEGVTKEQFYRNYFDRPRKPFYFFGYDQWRKIPYDETSRIEQNIRNQENLDRTGKSVIDKLSSRIKHIFSKDGGLKKQDIEQMDIGDPMQDLLVEGDVHKVHDTIPNETPSSGEFAELQNTRGRMYSLAGANAIRGEVMSDTATSSQIAREADFTRADDLVEDTISDASEWMSQWAMHLIKLRYTEDHFQKFSGARGKMTFLKLNRDMIEDGMEVQIKSSGTDKIKVQKTAMEMAGMKLIDPYTFYKDMGLEDPEGRTENLLMSLTDPASYLSKIKGLGSTTPELVSSLMGSAAGQNIPNAPQSPLSPTTTAPPVQVTGQPPFPSSQDTSTQRQTPVGPPAGSPRVV